MPVEADEQVAPGKWIVAGFRPSAAATATALVPDDAVSPTPRSQTRAVASWELPSARDLDVGAVQEGGMRLEQRADPRESSSGSPRTAWTAHGRA